MNRFTVLMIFLMLGMMSLVSAEEPFGVFANSNTNNIQFIDPENYSTRGPLLAGDLGTYGGGLFDVVITHDNKTAIVSNFGDSKIFFIDISGGLDAYPVRLGSTRIGMFAEDMDITPDDKYVLVADGGFSAQISVVEIKCRNLVKNNFLGTKYFNSVNVIERSGEYLVLGSDYFAGAVHVFKLIRAGTNKGSMEFVKTVRIIPFRPVNLAVSPDGKTVIAVIAGYSACVVLYFNKSGELVTGVTGNTKGIVAMPSMNGQSCVFSEDGTKAYYLSNSWNKGTLVNVLDVISGFPPTVSPTDVSIPIMAARGTSQLFGVDTIALGPDGKLYVTNPTLSGGMADAAVVDLTPGAEAQIGFIPTNGIPTGIAFTTSGGGEE
jgi:WD40 repeat protein